MVPEREALEPATELAHQTPSPPFDVRAARLALRMAAIAKLFHGDDWLDRLPTSREDLDAIYTHQSEWMALDYLGLQKAALEIIANPGEFSAWQRRLGPVVLSPKEVQRLQERRDRFEQFKIEHRKRLEERRRNLPEEGGAFQGADSCGSGLLGLLKNQDDAETTRTAATARTTVTRRLTDG